ncbi:hypothetical protein A1O1_05518 [Capronia coronata CBS 617.96]|uniref:Uncharacterized protein n=1 Tax=Capronia coronata CBS 617.96 TaxID=1182541 RepID=W9Y7T5_9EURO|nr:uncharacterized protein A1O1_05518 [Capronia coronata CBS 617.96]EXJ88588.1 hypothetical protein A1O1_05518 [Capronia coronata CBS 617.96]
MESSQPDRISTSAPKVNASTSPRPRPTSWATTQSRHTSLGSPGLSSLHSPSSPLLDDKFESMFRPISGSYRSSKVPVVEVTARPSSDDDGLASVGTEKMDQFPAEPSKLSYLPENIWYLLVDIVLSAIPLVFIVYGILAACLHGRPTASFYFGDDGYNWSGELYGPAMLIVQNYIPTFFPMAFGLTVARLIQAFALWRAQSGTHLGFIEQLMGSASLGGTIGALWGLHIINWIGLLLLALWALAPVGSQAGLRIISANGTYVNTTTINYMNSSAIPTGLETENDEIQFYTYAVNAIYSTLILTPGAMAGPQDPWSNVKIPSLEWLERNNGSDDLGWCSRALVKERSGLNQSVVKAGTWTSLSGLPVVGGEYGVGFQNFTLSASYWVLNCTSLEYIDPSERFSSPLPGRGDYDTDNISSIWDSGNSERPNTFFVDTTTPLAGLGSAEGDARSNGTQLSPRTLIFGSRATAGTSLAICTVATSYVLAEVNCNFTAPLWNIDKTASGRTSAGACYVDRVRRDPAHPVHEALTPLDVTYRIAQRLFSQWPLATGTVPAGTSSPTERFINDVNSESASGSANSILVATDWLGFNTSDHDNDGGISYVNMASLDLDTFTERLSLLFNTYWHAYCNLQAMTQSEIGLGFGSLFPSNVMFRSADAQMLIAGQHFVVNFAWLAVYMVCCVVAFVAGILALILQVRTLVPDVLGTVSMLVKENPYTPVPEGGSALDGHEYSQKVMNMPVKFCDVKPHDPVGHIALTSLDVEDAEGRIAPVRRDRLYQ